MSQTIDNKEFMETAQNCSQLLTSANEKAAQLTEHHGPEALSERQLHALELIVGGATDTAVAATLRVGRRTVYSWRIENLVFRAELQKRRKELYEQNIDRFRSMLGAALDRLETQIRDPYAPTSMRAARTLLALARVGQAVVAQGKASADPTEQREPPQLTGFERPHINGRLSQHENP